MECEDSSRLSDTTSDESAIKDDFPDGGLRAWLVVAGSCLSLFPTFGFIVAIGTLQDYWSTHQFSDYAARDVGWISSTFAFLPLALGIFIGPLFDRYGPRWILLVGSIGYVAMLLLLAECATYWQVLLCCGVLGGTTAAMVTTAGLAVVAHWFKDRRGLAQGVAGLGTSTGGVVFPLVLEHTLSRYGYAWSVRIVGLIAAFCLILANMLVQGRTVCAHKRSSARHIFSLSLYGDLRVILLIISVFGMEIVLFTALGVLPTYASAQPSYPPSTRFYLVSVLNAASCLGRLGPGYLSDKIGRFNTLLIMMAFTLVWMLALWLPLGQTSLAALYAFTALFGFGTGSWMALIPACIGQLCRADEFGKYYGAVYTVASGVKNREQRDIWLYALEA
ncbi:major facilitator superfamily domain-containing protein [Microdochium trichocladiopsis]|uniref:Major facilitator superfamily domain-containing protein n=1 Tax=Microdochium trichocladiopsis TaxID=1682393 RepID=A0A9P8XVB4_9PEZI|nr:major facilitator superfamily domain-containing protein [Microdochium trichocladiopsis]KAH7020824.1 major facilitator superfamily domain-containing protein [Microdochium trichocladiopsis]